MNLILSSLYRNHTLQIWQYPTGLFGYAALDPAGVEITRSAGNYASLNIAATNGIVALDGIIDLPVQVEQIAQMIADRDQQMGGN